MTDWVGQHIDDYRLIRLLGTGSFGEVYLGEHLHDRTWAAVKMLSLKQENWKEFVKEASMTFRLRHPHIIHLLAFGMSADDIPYLVMDYAPNGTLRQRHTKGARLSLDTIVSYLMPLAEALQYAHDRRVIHRDVKPENVLIGQDRQVLLSDFGLALITPVERSLSTQNLGGTVPYMAPEQIRGKPQPASDQYALGIMAYEWLCGMRPFQGTTLWEILEQHRSRQPPPLREKLPDLPVMVEEIILKALAKEPQERFARIQDFATALEQVSHVENPSPLLSSSSLLVALSPTDVSPQPGQIPDSSAVAHPQHVPDSSAIVVPIVTASQPSIQPSLSAEPSITHDPLAPSLSPQEASSPQTIGPTDGDIPREHHAGSLRPLKRASEALDEMPAPQPRRLVRSRQTSAIPDNQHRDIPSQSPSSEDDVFNSQNSRASSSLVTALHPPIPHSYQKKLTARPLLLMALCLALLMSFAGGETWTFLKQQQRLNSQHATATVQAALFATATVQAAPFATATAATTDYNTFVATKGIQSGFDAQRTQNNPYERILSPSNVNRLVQTWTAQTGGQISYSSPAVANGVVYVGSDDHKLYAFKADGCGQSACSPLWTAPTGSVMTSPAVANGVVYVGSYDGKLYAFKAEGCGQATCPAIWTAQTGDIIVSSPAVVNGVVYVGSRDDKLYAFKAEGCGQATCPAIWTAQAGSTIDSSPAVANGVVYAGSGDGKLYAFKAEGCGQATCPAIWTAQTGSPIYSSPVVANGVVYVRPVPGDGKLYAFKAEGCGQATCPAIWTAQTSSSNGSSPAVANGIVYVSSGDGKLYAFKAEGCGQATCPAIWTAQTGPWVTQANAPIESSPAVANGVVYVGSDDGKLYAFKAEGCGQATCPAIWTAQTGDAIDSSPAVANGVVYAGSRDHKLYAFHL